MRLRRRKKKVIDITPETVVTEYYGQQGLEGNDVEENDNEEIEETYEEKNKIEKNKIKSKKLISSQNQQANQIKSPGSLFRKIVQNPNLNSQIMVIIFSLLSDNVQLNRPLETMTSTIDKVRNISDVLNSTMQSVKVATEVPKQIRRLLK